MLVPQTQFEKQKNEPFIPNKRIFIGYSGVNFNAAHKQSKLKSKTGLVRVEVAMSTLVEAIKDIRVIRGAFAKISVSDTGRRGQYMLLDAPTWKQVQKVRKNVKKRVRVNPDKKVLIVLAMAGHGMQMDGRQIVLVNTFNRKRNFYEFWPVEADVRDISGKYRNSYVVALFACCREIYSTKNHSKLFGGTEQQAYVHFDKLAHAEHMSKAIEASATKAEALNKLQRYSDRTIE